MQKIYFISDAKYVNPSGREGGVKQCTSDFIKLFKTRFEVEIIQIAHREDFLYKLSVRLGLDVYNTYSPQDFAKSLENFPVTNKWMFALNMSNTVALSKVIKEKFGRNATIFLLSHGNESGDFLHQFTRFASSQSFLKRLTSTYKLGLLLKKEAFFRQKFIDKVLAVSPVENEIEKWLNAPESFMIPRNVTPNFISINPILGRVGFFGDLSHYPNYFAVESLCNSLKKRNEKVEFRLVGGPESFGKELEQIFPFIKYQGYLDEKQLIEEVSSWSFFLNIAFYYSRGVSTKLAKALSYGIPIISTSIGNRGYLWKEGKILTGTSPDNVADLIVENCFSQACIYEAQDQSKLVALSTPTFFEIMDSVYDRLINPPSKTFQN